MLTDKQTYFLLKASLREDIGSGDISADLIPESVVAKGDAIFKEPGVLHGITVAETLFRMIDSDLRFLPAAKNGEWIEPGRAIFYIEGSCRGILTAERTALNFLQHLSGVATVAKQFVDAVSGTQARILHTRKTTPLLRKLEREAVMSVGGHPHRQGLYDGILIKDNHLRAMTSMNLGEIIHSAREGRSRRIGIGVEVQTFKELEQVLKHDCDYILLDNFKPEEVSKAVAMRETSKSKVALEASGNIHLGNVREYAEAGVDRISIGKLTHSVKAIDISLNLLST